MAEARVLVAFAALVVLALLFAERGVRAALAPLCAVGSVVVFLSLFACLGLLRLGGFLLYAAAVVALGWLVYRFVGKKATWPRLSFGFWFFVVAGLLVMALLWARQPMFTGWDEFSLWGVGTKLLKLYDELYVTAPVGWAWTQTQKPGLFVLGYFFQFFGAGFSEWQCYVATDVFLLAMMAAVLGGVAEKKDSNAAFPLAVTLLLVPYVFYHYENVTRLSQAYLDTLADIPLGFAFAGALAAWYAGRKNRLWDMLPLCLALAVLTLVKDTGFALALVVAVLATLDFWLGSGTGAKQRLKGALARLGLGVGSVVAVFAGWDTYVKLATGEGRAASEGGTAAMGIAEMPAAFLRDVLVAEKSDFFKEIAGTMVRFFFTARGNMLGSGLVIMLLVWGIVAAAAALWRGQRQWRRCLVFGVFSTLGFALWYLLITMSYLYILRPEQALAFESYDRYVYPYYIGWLLTALLLLTQAVADAAPQRALWGKLGLCALALLLFVRVGQLVPVQYTLLGVHSDEFNARRVFAAKVQRLRGHLDPGGKTFLVMSDDVGIGWFMYCHEMLPWQMDYSYGGMMVSDFASGAVDENGQEITEKRAPTLGEWEAHLIETGCTSVYIDYANPLFIETYGALFADGMQGYINGQSSLYEVRRENGQVLLVPMDVWL